MIYWQNTYVHLAFKCLEQLRIRDLYDVFALEELLLDDKPAEELLTQQQFKQYLSKKRGCFSKTDNLRLIGLMVLSQSISINKTDVEDFLKVANLNVGWVKKTFVGIF